ncbi:MAG: cysteine hydrolase [Actinomycetia bacterium]|nr:cysteine hydrolase [Actinomycetes bacterium]
MAIDPSSSALIINDMQVDAIGPEGAFADSGAPEHAISQNVVAQVNRLADAARAAGMPVIWVVHYETASHADTKQNAEIFKGIVEADSLVKDTPGAALVPGCEPQDADLIVEKQRMSAFAGTSLDAKLRGLGVEKIVISGAWTNFSVEGTARQGADIGYEVVVVTDGTVTMNDEWQNVALNYALTTIAERLSVDEVIEAIGA